MQVGRGSTKVHLEKRGMSKSCFWNKSLKASVGAPWMLFKCFLWSGRPKWKRQISCGSLLRGVTQSSFLSTEERVQTAGSLTSKALFDLRAYGFVVWRNLSRGTGEGAFQERGTTQVRKYQWLCCRYGVDEEVADGVSEAHRQSKFPPAGCQLADRWCVTWVQTD